MSTNQDTLPEKKARPKSAALSKLKKKAKLLKYTRATGDSPTGGDSEAGIALAVPELNKLASKTSQGRVSKGVASKTSQRRVAKGDISGRFNEGPIPDENVARSPSRLGYTEDITLATENSLVENGSQESARDNFQLLDLEQSAQEPQSNKQYIDTLTQHHLETKETAQQTDSLTRLSSDGTPHHLDINPKPAKEYVSSRKFLNETGLSPKRPFEKTVFYVKTLPGEELTKKKEELTKGDKCGVTNVLSKPISSSKVRQGDTHSIRKDRIDSGYASRQGTIRNIPPQSAKSVSTVQPSEGPQSSTMSLYGTEIYSPPSSSRKQEKEDLQKLNERFTAYIQKIRQQNDQNVRIDANLFMQQTRVLEEEVANLKTMYERELDAIRHELDATSREMHNYQIQCQKNKDSAIDLESRLSVETDKNRRLMDDLNLSQRRASNLETELMEIRQAGDGRVDFQHLQREYDKILRENNDLKHRQEQVSLLRTEADDRCHTLTKKMEFNEQVQAQQIAELKERLEQSAATVISLESRVRDLTKTDMSIPQVLQQVRDSSEIELRRYQIESEETYNRNIAALKCQMDNDAHTIEKISAEKSLLQGQIGELQAKIRTLEGQISVLTHQKNSAEDLIKQQRTRSQEQVQEIEKKLHDMQELVFTKMREANSARDLNIPLKAEIEAMKALLEEEEKRLQTPLTPLSFQQTTYISPQPAVPVLPPASQIPPVPPQSAPGSLAHHATAKDNIFITQAPHQPLVPSAPILSPIITQELEPPITGEPVFTTMSVPISTGLEGTHDYTAATRYTYETTPSINRLQIEPSSYQMTSPRVVGPISRAKSAPAHSQRHTAPLVPANLGQGKDYFDEMFKDLTRETLYTQTRPKSSPTEHQPIEPEPSGITEKPPSPRAESPIEKPLSGRSGSDRPPSSVYHDYTTTTSSAVGDIKILEVNQEGRYVRLVNEGKQEVEFGDYMIQQNVGGHPVAVYRFPPRTKFPDSSTITVWSGMTDSLEHQPPKDYVWAEQQKWGTGPECTTILCKPNGQAIAWTTAAHRFTRNPYEDSPIRPSSEADVQTEEKQTTQEECLTEVNVNLNEPKPEPVFLRREKQSPPSLLAQKHPHGTSPGHETHPHTGQPRPYTYGNDNSSVNRQSRVQSTRPDPVQGQPYAGGNRIGSAPLRKYTSATSGNIRGSGALANRSEPGVTSPPPTPFQTPKNRFVAGLEQVKSQHHPDFLPPMPRPPLFSAW